MDKIKAFFMNKENRPKIIGIAVALAVVIVGIIVAVVVSMNTAQEKRTSVAGAIEIFTTVDDVPPASVMIAPASDEWWNNLLQYTSDRNLDAVKYGDISEGAKNIAFSVSKGGQYKVASPLGVPTTYVVYDTVENAKKAETAMINAGIQNYLHENVLIFIQPGIFSDVDYTLAALKDEETDTIKPLEMNSAQWTINFANFKEVYSLYFVKPEDSLTFDKISQALGLTESTTWEGTSKDGLTWEGKFNNLNTASVKSPEEIVSVITSADKEQSEKMRELIEAGPAPVEGGDYTLPLTPKIQRMLPSCCLSVTDNEKTVGSYIFDEQSIQLKPLEKSEGIFGMSFLINDFLTILAGDTSVYPVSNWILATVILENTNGDSKIIFTKEPKLGDDFVLLKNNEAPEGVEFEDTQKNVSE